VSLGARLPASLTDYDEHRHTLEHLIDNNTYMPRAVDRSLPVDVSYLHLSSHGVTGMPGHGKVQVQGTSENWWSRVARGYGLVRGSSRTERRKPGTAVETPYIRISGAREACH
jgi:hypothetical protein